jgi:hypothetical protein
MRFKSGAQSSARNMRPVLLQFGGGAAMTDAAASPEAAPRLKRSKWRRKYVHQFTDRHGRQRFYFRRPGFPTVVLPPPWSPEFAAAYHAALSGAALPQPSTLVGGVIAKRGVEANSRMTAGIIAKRGVDPYTVQPLIGVYLLMRGGRLVYIGRRVAEHRANGRPFDKAHFIATKANEREQLEQALIRALHPSQNRSHRTTPRDLVADHAAHDRA